ncbi:hypothetical protein ACFVAV_35145 [Nocardia sp. NPDC057663]|uniref:hypothetical protein n=1 Tax=Nocardia sp. NPDC057663 TaxID=3346201 RepID=UPI00366ADEA9
MNPLVFITKRSIPDSFMRLAKSISQPVVFYISYSGLAGSGLEPTVSSAVLQDNFIRLEELDLPRVHYWRPFVPQNSHPDVIAEILEFVSEHALCSAVNGLKLNDGIRDHVAPFWPELMDIDYEFENVGDFWPAGVRNFLREYAQGVRPDYPLFFDTACALAFALRKPDIQGALSGRECLDSQCPSAQRKKCHSAHQRPSLDLVRQAGEAVGIESANITMADDVILVSSSVPTESLTYMRTVLRYPIKSMSVDYLGHNWASNIDALQPIVEVPWRTPSVGNLLISTTGFDKKKTTEQFGCGCGDASI